MTAGKLALAHRSVNCALRFIPRLFQTCHVASRCGCSRWRQCAIFARSANCRASNIGATKPRQHTDDIMPHQFSLAQAIRKPAIKSRGGIVAAQSRRAAEVGAQVLAAGGDCVDAIVATTFALNVLEPWNSGIGGGGAMVLYRAKENRYEVIDYGMCAPQSLRSADYPLSGERRSFRSVSLVAGEGRPQHPRPRRDRRARRRRRHGRGASSPRQAAVEGSGRAVSRARRRRPAGRLVDHTDHRERGRRPSPLSRERGSVPEGRPAAKPAMGHQVRDATAAGQVEGDTVAPRRSRAARLLPGRSRQEHRLRHPGRRRRAVGGGPRGVPQLSARAAGDPLSRRQGVCDAGAHGRTDIGACAAPVAAESEAGRHA